MYGLFVLSLVVTVIVWFARQFNETNSKKWFRRLRPAGYLLGALARNVAADVRALRQLPAEWRFHRQLKGGP